MLSQTFQQIRDGLLSLAYPQECRICGRSVESWNDGVVCALCWNDPSLTRLFTQAACCHKCNAPLNQAQGFPALHQSPTVAAGQTDCCGQCADLPFSFARSCGAYGGALKANLLFLKSQPHICRRLRDLLLRTFAANQAVLASDWLIPVPLHPLRQLERGFNQAELLARLLASHFHLRLNTRALARAQNTERHRAGMDAFERLKSVERAFRITDTGSLKNASVLLLDDLLTTGSTISAAARTLLQAGATEVKVFTIARVTAGNPG